MEEALKLKENGNKLFSQGMYKDASLTYSKALAIENVSDDDRMVFLKNRAACYLKMSKYSEAIIDCSKVLERSPTDSKALFRRCQAYEGEGRLEEAYKDARLLSQVEPKNQAIQPILRRLHFAIQDKVSKQMSTDNRVSQMFDLAFKGKLDNDDDDEKRKQATNNLIVLAREPAGAEKIFNSGGSKKLIQLVDFEKDKEIKVTAIRVLSCLVYEDKVRAQKILEELTLKKVLIYIGSDDENISTAMTHFLQNVINSLSKLEDIKKEREKHENDQTKNYLDTTFLRPLLQSLTNGKCSSFGRDNIMELLIKFVTRKDGVGWSGKFIEVGGRCIQQALTVAGTVPESKVLSVSTNSRMHVSLLLSKVYEDLISDQEREKFQEAAEAYFLDLFKDEIVDSKLEAVLALAALLQGAPTVGNSILSREGVLDIILAMADSGDAIYVKYAVEALVQSASKKEKCSGVIKQATPILKQLYQSSQDAVKVRALVGLCKLGSFGGDDASVKAFADGSNLTLSKACRKFLCNPTKDVDLRKWAAEGLAYLTLDADVKEELANDLNSLKSLIDLAKVVVPDKGILYPVAQIFVNVTNSYDKKEIDPELLELAKYAKQHIPEEHEKALFSLLDKEPCISQRVTKLVKAGIVNALVAFSKSESESSNELLARIYLAVCANADHRGLVVQQGGVKTLLPLANEGTEAGKIKASHALAKIAVTQNPDIAFPGQRSCEVVRPLLKLLSIDRTALESYEALLALTNLASSSDAVRKRIVQEKGFSYIEHFCYEDHDQLKLAATECLCNLVQNDEVAKMFLGQNDRVKLFVLFSGSEEDEKLVMASSGALATLTFDPAICRKVIESTKQWFEIMQGLLAHENPEIQHRGTFIIYNMMCADKEMATRLVESNMLEVLMAVSKLDEPERKNARQMAEKALKQAEEWGLVTHVADGGETQRK
ncbi:hypothetical protein HELRODRAFT_110263 [Helobdella robusta]|uniref:Protein unc-45 homolog B n=1 Tax=Helobdella robusta TaxID=6412 RepID=T1EF09_HELRO|nr:hypothetical protein HELRODRAFT_110263 [Helobdella robusta]ESO08016.1 hypothetical protein HELRODRAFT_110263 [Helobdella robusta]